MTPDAHPGRVAELTIALSLATDLGTGQPMEHGLRTCWLSLAVARALGLDDDTRSCVYYVALLRFVGCTSDASEIAALAGGDDVAFNAAMAPVLMAQPGEGLRHFVRHLGEDQPAPRRVGLVARALADPGLDARSSSGHCEVAARLARRLGLDDTGLRRARPRLRTVGRQGTPRRSGRRGGTGGRPDRRRRPRRRAVRPRAGWPAAVEVLSRRRGHGYDPAVVDAFAGRRAAAGWPSSATIRAPRCSTLSRHRCARSPPDELDAALERDRRLHRPQVAVVPRALGRRVPSRRGGGRSRRSVRRPTQRRCGRAALVHDVGQVGIPSGVWDRPARSPPSSGSACGCTLT